MSKTKTTPYDVADYLSTPEDCAAYLDASIEESNGDAAFIARALGDIARAQGMTRIAQEVGLSRESLGNELSGDHIPDFAMVLKVTRALGVRLHASTI